MKNRPRREFLELAGAGIASALAGPYVLNAEVLAAPPSDRINMGHIGVGGMGSGHLGRFCRNSREPTIAICDVDKGHRERAARRCARKVELYNDYRDLLDNPDVDAVVVAVPDHWHALITIHSCHCLLYTSPSPRD